MVLKNKINPGKLSAFLDWAEKEDAKRKAANPDYVPPNRYITVYGNATELFIEAEVEEIPPHPNSWSEQDYEGVSDLFDTVVPGETEWTVLKKL